MKKLLFTCFVSCFMAGFSADIDHKTGVWIGEDAQKWHVFDDKLADAIAKFFVGEKADSVIDFGCGMGGYMKVIHDMGILCDGVDGNPATPELTGGLGKVLDFSVPVDLGRTYDWVLSLEVGEHLPPQHETTFIENLVKHAREGILLSWACQNGPGHFNMRENDYVKGRMKEYGYISDPIAEKFLRKRCNVHWFRNTVMVFRKAQ